MKSPVTIVMVFMLLFLASCYKQGSTVTATGRVNFQTDGTAVSETDQDMITGHRAMREVNRRYPNKPPFAAKEEFLVQDVEPDGVVVLDTRGKVELAGIVCRGATSEKYLRRFLQGKTVRFVPVSDPNQANSGYVWTVDYSFVNDPKLKDSARGPSYACANEVAILSGWCRVDEEAEHALAKRFSRIQDIADDLQEK